MSDKTWNGSITVIAALEVASTNVVFLSDQQF